MGFDSNIIQKYKTEHIKPQFLFLSELVRSVFQKKIQNFISKNNMSCINMRKWHIL